MDESPIEEMKGRTEGKISRQRSFSNGRCTADRLWAPGGELALVQGSAENRQGALVAAPSARRSLARSPAESPMARVVP
jgi:hypothetical protein